MNKWSLFYPRPHLKRDSFISLDGKWTLNNYEIEIPFAPESKLSNYQGPKDTTEFNYSKEFPIPKEFKKVSQRLILHFGAVDQIADIYLNDNHLLHHEGGYLPFEIDITDFLTTYNILKVKAIDTLDIFYPYGKQTNNPQGMWYTPVSGIWQSVWLEIVPRSYIKGLIINTNKDEITIDIDSNDFAFFVDIPLDKKKHFKQYYETKHIIIPYSLLGNELHYWSCSDPYLYDITISTKNDTVSSYFGIKYIERKIINGYPRLYLNSKPLFIKGVLDQGYFEDGIYLPNDPQEYFNDVLRMKELGFNLLRKHIKVEPEVFYYACDKLGMLVMQDFVNSGKFHSILDTIIPTIGFKSKPDNIFINKKRLEFFKEHSKGIINNVDMHPSIIGYTIYNEGWGQQDSDNCYREFKEIVKDKLLDSTSGWFRQKESDFDSHHIYFRNKILSSRSNQLLLLSECAGYKRSIEGHLYNPQAEYGYGKGNSEEELTLKYKNLFEKMINPSIKKGLCGFIITQVSDVETEINGLYTYDRQIVKINKKEILKYNTEAEDLYISLSKED